MVFAFRFLTVFVYKVAFTFDMVEPLHIELLLFDHSSINRTALWINMHVLFRILFLFFLFLRLLVVANVHVRTRDILHYVMVIHAIYHQNQSLLRDLVCVKLIEGHTQFFMIIFSQSIDGFVGERFFVDRDEAEFNRLVRCVEVRDDCIDHDAQATFIRYEHGALQFIGGSIATHYKLYGHLVANLVHVNAFNRWLPLFIITSFV
mmetsp:Transcript_43032/g.68986  ORF Transcript_43032/g.68986 Transcript_43032/m.68986 type:complete len:205 (-) Transcript_43032:348-962(-)